MSYIHVSICRCVIESCWHRLFVILVTNYCKTIWLVYSLSSSSSLSLLRRCSFVWSDDRLSQQLTEVHGVSSISEILASIQQNCKWTLGCSMLWQLHVGIANSMKMIVCLCSRFIYLFCLPSMPSIESYFSVFVANSSPNDCQLSSMINHLVPFFRKTL